MPYEQAVLDEMKREVAGVRDFLTTTVNPLKAETDRIAQNLLALQKELRDARKSDLMRSNDYQQTLIQTGPYAGLQPLDILISASLLGKQQPKDAEHLKQLQTWRAHIKDTLQLPILDRSRAQIAAALDSTTAAAGDELVNTGEASQLWMDVNLDTVVAAQIMRIPMPTNPFDLPLQFGAINFFPGTENVSTKSTAPSTAKSTLTAYELVGEVPWSYHLDEDSVVAVMPAQREHMAREVAHVLEDIILNADTTLTNNINADGATIAADTAAKGQWVLGYDGLIHLPLIEAAAAMRTNVAGAIADGTVNTLRKAMGKYAVRPSDCLIVTDLYTWIAAQTLTNIRTLDKIGDRATILQGQFGSFDGIPWLVSEDMLRADTDGLVTDAGNVTNTGRVLLFNKTQWMQGFRREISFETVRDAQKRQNILIVSFRHALQARGTRSSATHTALAYNITGI